jgi:hypothetical protein
MLLSELPFEPIGTSTPGPNTGFIVAGADIAALYAPASVGTPSGVVTGFTKAGVDIGTLFAGVGTTKKLLSGWAAWYTASAAGSLTVAAGVYLTFKPDGTYESVYGSGRWLAANLVGADYEIIATAVSGSLDTNNMVAYAQLNTNRVLGITISAGPTVGFQQKTVVAAITIRKVTEPTTLVTGQVTMVVNAESFGSGPPP